MDFLNPTIETIQQSLNTAWSQLPPPVQQAAPFVGVAVGSGLVVYVVQQRRLNNQVQQGGRARGVGTRDMEAVQPCACSFGAYMRIICCAGWIIATVFCV